MRKINIGHVGLGRLGKQHASNIANRLQYATLKALCDVNEEHLKRLAKGWAVG